MQLRFPSAQSSKWDVLRLDTIQTILSVLSFTSVLIVCSSGESRPKKRPTVHNRSTACNPMLVASNTEVLFVLESAQPNLHDCQSLCVVTLTLGAR